MKNVFRKMRGKKDDEEGIGRKFKDERGRSGPATAPQNQPFKPPPAQNQNVGQQPTPATSGSVTRANAAMRNTVPPPLGDLSALLASPASSPAAGDPRDLIQIHPPALCPVCYNLDPYQAPPDNSEIRQSWARTEYSHLPTGTPVAKIALEKSEALLESANRGCIYCCMVQTALGAVHPGWETEKSFIHLFLAPGLPVVARLEFGATHTIALGREAVRERYGIELREGQNMNFVITLVDPSKPAIDIEIYRPRLGPDQTTASDLVLSPLVAHMGTAEEIPAHAGEPKCFDFINEKLAQCMKGHNYGQDGHLPLLPDRVIWIEANNASHIQLIEPKDIRAKYIALSYCWGPVSPDTYLTNASTFTARKAGMQYSDLPPLIQDVVSIARVLRIEYIWIDRLCIIQGSAEDFTSQAPQMGEIYGNATLTIAAVTATSENDRILIDREIKWASYNLDMNVNGIGALKLRFRRRTHPLGTEDKGGDYGKVSTRAWIWQERLLSGRTVFYTPSALKFECHHHSVWEGFAQGVTGHSWSAQLENISHLSWTTLVEEYMSRSITRPSDRLPALESVMRRISKSTRWSPLWGMWANALVESLGWQSKALSGENTRECRMNPAHYAPTWSWASVDGPISHASTKLMEGPQDAYDPMIYDLEVQKLNPRSGLITVAAHAVAVELACRVEPNNDPTPQKYRYRYEAMNVYSRGEGFPIQADVALKPWAGKLNGRDIQTVVRVPYGETPPEESWKAKVLCLLVGKMKLRTLVLFLGQSVREVGAWERIGMVDGLEPKMFEVSERRIFNVV